MIYRIHLPDGTYNTVVADQAFIDAHFPGAELVPEPAPVQTSVVPQSVSEEPLDTLFITANELQL